MTTPGNDPFSGTTTRDLLQHVISPKVVSDGSSGYAVKTDLINIDGIYAKGIIRAGTSGSGDVQTTSAFTVLDPTYTTTYSRITGTPSTTYIQGTSGIRFGQIAQSSTNTVLNIGTGGSNNDIFTVGGSIYVRSTPTVGGTGQYFLSNESGVTRWAIGLQPAETGGNAGADFRIYAYNDAGAFITSPLQIVRATGIVSTPAGFDGKSKGTVTANNATPVVVSNPNVTADSIILLTVKTATGANAGQANVVSKTASTGFSIASGAADTSVYNYMILN